MLRSRYHPDKYEHMSDTFKPEAAEKRKTKKSRGRRTLYSWPKDKWMHTLLSKRLK